MKCSCPWCPAEVEVGSDGEEYVSMMGQPTCCKHSWEGLLGSLKEGPKKTVPIQTGTTVVWLEETGSPESGPTGHLIQVEGMVDHVLPNGDLVVSTPGADGEDTTVNIKRSWLFSAHRWDEDGEVVEMFNQQEKEET